MSRACSTAYPTSAVLPTPGFTAHDERACRTLACVRKETVDPRLLARPPEQHVQNVPVRILVR